MTLLDIREKAFANGEATILYDRVKVEQHLAQRIDLWQIRHLRAQPKGGQLFQQGRQFLALRRVLTPAMQKILGIQQDVHAFRQEQRNHARIPGLALIRFATRPGSSQTLLMQCLHLGDERLGTLDGRQRIMVQILQPTTQQLLRGMQELRIGQIQGNQVGLEFLGHFLQRRGNLRHGQDACHMGAALERMKGTLQVVGDRLRKALRAIGQKIDQGCEVSIRLVTENLQ